MRLGTFEINGMVVVGRSLNCQLNSLVNCQDLICKQIKYNMTRIIL
jgi:hypothetical protein